MVAAPELDALGVEVGGQAGNLEVFAPAGRRDTGRRRAKWE